jgi:tetratricopeptide (TPR) repeat protein
VLQPLLRGVQGVERALPAQPAQPALLDCLPRQVYDAPEMSKNQIYHRGQGARWWTERRSALLVGLALGLAAAPPALCADVIYLKNGNKIVADSTREDSKQLIYQAAGGEFSIPRDLVDHIDKSTPATPPPADSTSTQRIPARDLPLPQPTQGIARSEARSLVVRQNQVDEGYLRELDRAVDDKPTPENRRLLAQAYQEAATFLARQGDADGAIEKCQHALRLVENDPGLTTTLAYFLVKQDRPWQAIELLLPAQDRNPQNPDIRLLLGSAYYAMDDLDQAIREWNQARAIQENPSVREAVEKAQRERDWAGTYQELRSQHFLLHYDEGEVKALGNEVLSKLEDIFQELEQDLDIYPHETITVLMYPNQAFRDITRSPNWAGAVNDGKLRIPVSGLQSVTPELAAVLKHELTHSFVRQETQGHCPQWFNEGLAQLEEGKKTEAFGAELAHFMATGQAPPYSGIEGSFMKLPDTQAKQAYAKSLAALEYLRDAHGMTEIRQMLRLMVSNPEFSSILQQELQLTYSRFEEEVTAYILQRYGNR